MLKSQSPERQSPVEEGTRVRKASGFLTVGQASQGDGGFVRRLLETVGNTVTAQMDEVAGGFLLPKRESEVKCFPHPTFINYTASNTTCFPHVPQLSTPWKALVSHHL